MLSNYLSRSAETRSREAASLGGAERSAPGKCGDPSVSEGVSTFVRNAAFFGERRTSVYFFGVTSTTKSVMQASGTLAISLRQREELLPRELSEPK